MSVGDAPEWLTKLKDDYGEIIFEFFVKYSKLEYVAIKSSSHLVKQGESFKWNLFRKSIVNEGGITQADINSSLIYFRDKPVENLKDGKKPVEDKQDNLLNNLKFIMLNMRSARDNLFHGDKLPFSDNDVERLEKCIEAIDILVRSFPETLKNLYNQ